VHRLADEVGVGRAAPPESTAEESAKRHASIDRDRRGYGLARRSLRKGDIGCCGSETQVLLA
jgi:hypothetical protein